MLSTLIAFVVILGVLVLVHEIGHFAVARWFKIGVNEFGLGFPPRICGWKKMVGPKGGPARYRFFWGNQPAEGSDPIYSLNWIPFGGFVQIKGESGEIVATKEGENNKAIPDPDSYLSRPKYQKALVMVAGVVMNFILCGVLLTIGFGFGMPMSTDSLAGSAKISNPALTVASVMTGSPAEEAGLHLGDTLVAINGQNLVSMEQWQSSTASAVGQTLNLTVKRGGEILNLQATPKSAQDLEFLSQAEKSQLGNTGLLGISMTMMGEIKYPWWQAIWEGFRTAGIVCLNIVIILFTLVKSLFIEQGPSLDLSGPVGVAVMTGQSLQAGWMYLIQFVAILSANLCIVNLLPLPALDGGRLLFLGIEAIRRKPMRQSIENWAHSIGFILLLLLIVFITYRDIVRFGGKILGSLKDTIGV